MISSFRWHRLANSPAFIWCSALCVQTSVFSILSKTSQRIRKLHHSRNLHNHDSLKLTATKDILLVALDSTSIIYSAPCSWCLASWICTRCWLLVADFSLHDKLTSTFGHNPSIKLLQALDVVEKCISVFQASGLVYDNQLHLNSLIGHLATWDRSHWQGVSSWTRSERIVRQQDTCQSWQSLGVLLTGMKNETLQCTDQWQSHHKSQTFHSKIPAFCESTVLSRKNNWGVSGISRPPFTLPATKKQLHALLNHTIYSSWGICAVTVCITASCGSHLEALHKALWLNLQFRNQFHSTQIA